MAGKLAVTMAVGVALLQAVGTLSAGLHRSRESGTKATATSHLERDRGIMRREKEASDSDADGAPEIRIGEDAKPAMFLTQKEVRALDPMGECEATCKDCSGAVFNVPDNFNHSDGVWCFCLPNATFSTLTKAPGTWPGRNTGCTTGCNQNANYTADVCDSKVCMCDVNVNYASGQDDLIK